MEQKVFKKLQQFELDGATIYSRIAKFVKKTKDQETLIKMSKEEFNHADTFEKYSKVRLKPRKFIVNYYSFIARFLGYTFAIKLMERREERAVAIYKDKIIEIDELEKILKEEEHHEQQLLAILDEERLYYVGDIVLGMNDALVELTGALAGYTLALQNTHVIAMAGLITGVSATLSMAVSNYLASKEKEEKSAFKSAIYTGVTYLITVALLITPYLLLPVSAYMIALGITLATAILIIAGFNYYISVVKERKFRRNFIVMATISLLVASISFGFGILVKQVLGIDL